MPQCTPTQHNNKEKKKELGVLNLFQPGLNSTGWMHPLFFLPSWPFICKSLSGLCS
jgi:hypothetical protein